MTQRRATPRGKGLLPESRNTGLQYKVNNLREQATTTAQTDQ